MKTIRQLDSRLKIHAAFALLLAFSSTGFLWMAAQSGGPLLRGGVLSRAEVDRKTAEILGRS